MTPEEHLEDYIGNMKRFRNDLREEGSGTTGVAVLKLKRQVIGIEVDKERFEIASRNISRYLKNREAST